MLWGNNLVSWWPWVLLCACALQALVAQLLIPQSVVLGRPHQIRGCLSSATASGAWGARDSWSGTS
jgi:hypothetical protein